ncbi:hypothetical protein [Rugosimonospora africana]|uniref:Uncharacterized protein n=1 Tax=Rugosimonospora africana TaxID=556532 RepID=A0A8J3QYJ6_9ACTN|nr:hypothetical protein [Rugosimonospora africana]GIH19770.1 hypothetical protein Raf01_79420 [Rugosimonospora africana]
MWYAKGCAGTHAAPSLRSAPETRLSVASVNVTLLMRLPGNVVPISVDAGWFVAPGEGVRGTPAPDPAFDERAADIPDGPWQDVSVRQVPIASAAPRRQYPLIWPISLFSRTRSLVFPIRRDSSKDMVLWATRIRKRCRD